MDRLARVLNFGAAQSFGTEHLNLDYVQIVAYECFGYISSAFRSIYAGEFGRASLASCATSHEKMSGSVKLDLTNNPGKNSRYNYYFLPHSQNLKF